MERWQERKSTTLCQKLRITFLVFEKMEIGIYDLMIQGHLRLDLNDQNDRDDHNDHNETRELI